jgi:5'-nucleotidase
MKILVTNDDGILAEGLWILAKELKNVGHVVVVAPDREQSGIGAAITLKKPLRVQKVRPLVPEIEAYSVEGTPADSVILALEKLAKNKIDLVISGINHGPNLGYDVLVSGTVGAALQGYLRGFPALAISVFLRETRLYLDDAAKVAALLAERIASNALPANIFLNVNLPDLPLAEISGLKITRLDNKGHISAVEEGHNGPQNHYCLVPQEIKRGKDRKTDVWAVKQGNISITPLHIYQDSQDALIADSFFTARLGTDLFQELKKKGGQ